MSWSDSFYDTNDSRFNQDIIAAFDIDRTLHDRSLVKILIWYIWLPIISFFMIVAFTKIGVPFFVDILLVFPCHFFGVILCYLREKVTAPLYACCH